MTEDGTLRIIVGSKQVKRCLKKGQPLSKVVIARDANNKEDLDHILQECKIHNIQVVYEDSMKELGQKCNIDVSAAVVALMI